MNEMKMNMNPLIEQYLAERTSLGEITERTAGKMRARLLQFANAVDEASAADVSREDVKAWLGGLEVAPSTRSLAYSTVNAFFNWAVAEGHVTANPCLGVKRPKVPKGEPRSLTAAEVAEVRAQCRASGKQRGTLLFSLMYHEGLRCEEVASIQLHDLDLEGQTLHVRGKGYGGQRSRRVFLTPETAKAIGDYLAKYPEITSGPLIRSKMNRSQPMTAHKLSELMSGYMKRAGVKREAFDGVSAHALRHTAAEEMAANTPDIQVVQQFLGHANLATTQAYLRREVGGQAEAQAARFGGAR